MMNIIPKPLKFEEKGGFKIVDKNSVIYFESELRNIKEILCETFPVFSVCTVSDSKDNADVLFLLSEKLGEEAYVISIENNKAVIEASAYAGALYAVKTLEQLCFFEKENDKIDFPCIYVEDEPRYKHRGIMLDEARHFFGKNEVKRLLGLMAFYKLNTLHWHLTDDQGWRIEIKKYPLLTEIGSKRKDTQIGGWKSGKFEGKPYGGFYTQEEIKEIVSFAKRLGVTIIPEIDVPAHFASAIAAYNYLACREIKSEVHWFFGGHIPTTKLWIDFNRPCCAGKESTYEFIFNVLDEVTELFPGPFLHIGGDEAPKMEWKKCPECKKRMKENGLKDAEELQGYFNNRISNYLREKGKRLIVWNEALKAESLDRSTVGQYWTKKNDPNVLKHIENGGEVVICKHEAFYFDMCYDQYPLENTYDFEATDEMIPKEYENRVLGLEGEMWSEWIASREKLDLLLFPRALALSECCWVKNRKRDFPEFLQRKNAHEKMLDRMGVNYAVDEVSMPTGFFKRKWEQHLWTVKDTDRNLRKNRELKKQKRAGKTNA